MKLTHKDPELAARIERQMTPELQDILHEMWELQGRPEAGPLFFGYTEQDIRDTMIDGFARALEAGVLDPAWLWAFIRLDFFLTEMNERYFKRSERKRWRKEVQYYRRKKPDLAPFIKSARSRLQVLYARLNSISDMETKS